MYMENVKEHYWRYSLITIILGLGVILFFKMVIIYQFTPPYKKIDKSHFY